MRDMRPARTPRPWDGAIPAADLAAFGESAHDDRRITAAIHPAVIVVDMTRAFVDSAYPSGFAATGRPAVAANEVLLTVARSRGVPVFFTKAFADPGHVPLPVEQGRWKGVLSGPARR
jgi:maleamate amidohydrolase